ncbi:DUF1080 domain-containing protein [Lentisphaera profundi]|uniref:DUF1080 domain-containing protein n=1 Tax=Lentisphaera profundi TaxID=1658616 RepID=A0ABY7VSY3_9BACT|nr:family 16 glycoside hydrolase [Lentisphaera profundi]WDE97157.1 DUF1080 domain-containing protein [Lentisphaera profundi]
MRFLILLNLIFITSLAAEKASPELIKKESDYYRITDIPLPEGSNFEPSCMVELPNDKIAVGSRFGDVYIIENAYDDDTTNDRWRLFAKDLHEPLGMSYYKGDIWVVQRSEVTRLRDENKDGKADFYQCVSDDWGIMGDYHEYAFGSPHDKDGKMWIVLCLTGSVKSRADYRGWAITVDEHGKMEPVATGIRSPGGIGFNQEGDVFYSDNQGLWNGTSSIKHLKVGSFQGNPNSNASLELLKKGAKNFEPSDGGRLVIDRQRMPELLPPAVNFPHAKLGQSTSGLDYDKSKGKFGPFGGQLFVNDQSWSMVSRVYMEKVKGNYQGVAFPFKSGFDSGNLYMLMTERGSMFTCGTNRGWGSLGKKIGALQRVEWTGKVPFEIERMNITPKGFKLRFTKKVDPSTIKALGAYLVDANTWIYRAAYGSPEVDKETIKVTSAKLSQDQMSLEIELDKIFKGHTYNFKFPQIKTVKGEFLLHQEAYYSINEVLGEEIIRKPDADTFVEYIPKVALAADPTIKVTPPKVVEPKYQGEMLAAPKGAKILFDGSSLEGWKVKPNKRTKESNPKWKLLRNEQAMEVLSPTGINIFQESILTEGHLHIEWASPAKVLNKGQGRGNSGIFIEGFPEIQVLDSYENQTYPDGQAGALYKKSIPLVNACRKPGEWQCYDIYFERSKINPKSKKLSLGSLTVYHNNVLIQDHFKTSTSQGGGTLGMQDHNNPVRFRNIWFLENKTKR